MSVKIVKISLCVLFIAMCVAAPAFGGVYYWKGYVDNDWTNPSNWLLDGVGIEGPPTSFGDVAFMEPTGPVSSVGAGVNAVVGDLLTQGGHTMNISGSVSAGNKFIVNHTSGTSIVNLTGSGSINVGGGTLAEKELFVGSPGVGILNMAAGTSISTQLLRLGFGSGASGKLDMAGGSATANTNLIMGWDAGSSGELLMHGTSNMYVENLLIARGYGNSSHILLQDNAVLSTNVLNTGQGGSGDTNIDIWGGKLIARTDSVHWAGTLNIDIRNNGELIFPLSKKSILEGWIASTTLVAYDGNGTVVLTDDVNTVTATGLLIPPALAKNPNPANGAVNVDWNADLSWTAGQGAIAHNVYFGNDPNTLSLLSFQQTATTYALATLNYHRTYSWRIDEYDGSTTHTGVVWQFTTAWPNCAQLVGDLNNDCTVDFRDFALLSQSWLDCNWDPQDACNESNW